jgi:hypothetical protein
MPRKSGTTVDCQGRPARVVTALPAALRVNERGERAGRGSEKPRPSCRPWPGLSCAPLRSHGIQSDPSAGVNAVPRDAHRQAA